MDQTLVAPASIPVLEAPSGDADPVTEVVAGERLELLEERAGWWRVVVPAHETRLDRRGYPGWIPAHSAKAAGGWCPDLTVVIADNPRHLPLGALLESCPDGARLPGGETVDFPNHAVLPPGEPVGRSAVELSYSFLGLPYRWGGTDTTTGMDCSGMVYRVMQLLGIPVPRDADDQYEAAPYKSRENWESARVGDLVFFGDGSITHIGFYLGEGRYISEHGAGGTVIRNMQEDPYWGFARYEGWGSS